jgi:hypothetical protein
VARLERGKGRRKQVIEIVRLGNVLRMQETEAGDARLPGYRRFADAAAAAANVAVEVRSLLEDGMQAADAEARAIADAQPKKVSGPPALPIRQDLAIYNEANGFVVTSRKMAGKTLEEGSPEWNKAVTRGDMLPLMLVQDDPFIIRVVAGGALTPQEDEEWLARVDWHVNVPDGKLCITGGSVFTNGDYDSGDPYYEQYVGEVLIPRGRYRAALYTQAHGVNGGAVLDQLAGGLGKGEPLDEWFARTRPGDARVDVGETELVDFLLHLEPIDAAPKSGLSALPEEGWFGGAENARKPDRCPAGLAARDVISTAREETPGKWMFVRHVFELMPAHVVVQPVKGDPLTLALDSIGRAVRIAWFGSRLALAELRLTAPAGASIDLDGEWPEGVVGVADGDVVRILFDADLDGREIARRLPPLGPRFAAVPDGTVLEVCCAPVETFPGTPAGAGLVTFRGPIRGTWTIAHAYPAVNATTLRGALTLAAEVEGTAITVADVAEGNEILRAAKRYFGHHVEDNPPRFANGVVSFEKAGPEPALIGIPIFATRFGSTWPTAKLSALDDDDDGDDDDDNLDEEGDGLFPTTPIKGAEVLTAPSGRAYHATMSMLVSEKIGGEVPKRERPLFSAGFKHVGDVVCSADERLALRGYVKADGHTWAYFRIAAPDRIELELASTFAERDAALVTTGRDGERDDDASATYRQGFAGATAPELIAHHERRLAELTAVLGAPRPTERSLRNLAETLEALAAKSEHSR